jgi:hypothetical protein
VLALRNLAPDESRAYLSHRSVPSDLHQAVLGFTHGHPLALSLVADAFAQRGPFEFEPEPRRTSSARSSSASSRRSSPNSALLWRSARSLA